MRDVSFIMEAGCQVMGLAAMSAFELVNAFSGSAKYRLSVVSEKGGLTRTSLGIGIETQPLGDFPDTLMVVGELIPQTLSPALREYIREAGKRSRRVAGLCTGAFHLAEAGLLDERAATTHWGYAKLLKDRYPKVSLEQDRIFLQDGNIWTSAGMSSAIDLTLALIEDDHGTELSRDIARKLVVYHRRPGGQSQFSALLELNRDPTAFAAR